MIRKFIYRIKKTAQIKKAVIFSGGKIGSQLPNSITYVDKLTNPRKPLLEIVI